MRCAGHAVRVRSECNRWHMGWRASSGSSGLYEQFDGYFQHPRQKIKQADVLQALYLLPELRSGDLLRRNFERYDPVTEHGSSLSPCMHVLFARNGTRSFG